MPGKFQEGDQHLPETVSSKITQFQTLPFGAISRHPYKGAEEAQEGAGSLPVPVAYTDRQC
ncbi:hypothetical protein ACXYMU_04200 [Pontibacter sp. CAU 1760]